MGCLFAVIGNKYIIDSSLPETTSFTLVDTLNRGGKQKKEKQNDLPATCR